MLAGRAGGKLALQVSFAENWMDGALRAQGEKQPVLQSGQDPRTKITQEEITEV